MTRTLIAAALVLLATSAFAKDEMLGQMPKALLGEWCAINSEDLNTDWLRGSCQKHRRPDVDAMRITSHGIDFPEVECRLKYAYQNPHGYHATFSCQDTDMEVKRNAYWIGLNGKSLYMHKIETETQTAIKVTPK